MIVIINKIISIWFLRFCTILYLDVLVLAGNITTVHLYFKVIASLHGNSSEVYQCATIQD